MRKTSYIKHVDWLKVWIFMHSKKKEKSIFISSESLRPGFEASLTSWAMPRSRWWYWQSHQSSSVRRQPDSIPRVQGSHHSKSFSHKLDSNSRVFPSRWMLFCYFAKVVAKAHVILHDLDLLKHLFILLVRMRTDHSTLCNTSRTNAE